MSAQQRCQVLVVGTGAAGLSAAVGLARAGIDTIVMTKTALGGGSTAWAQGGLAAVEDPNDSLDQHLADTLEAGAGLCDREAVTELVAAAPDAIADLIALGAQFDRDDDGGLALGLEGGHHARRIVHAGGDASGAEVSRVLSSAVEQLCTEGLLRVVENTIAVDVLLDPAGRVHGVTTLSPEGGPGLVEADAVVLATGGIGQLWDATTNPTTSTGDGLALALRAGAVVRDVEFMQFHPTLLSAPGRGVLVSEAVRGEGAVLRDLSGEPVMSGVHPLGDLAPRDVVSAAMQQRMLRDGVDHLLLDGTALGADMWDDHFPTIQALCRERGVDPATTPIPVRPGAHYHCGGVAADLHGRTSVPGLYAVGEVAATGVHGANRLASNSLTEALVAGSRVAALLVAGPVGRTPSYREPAPLAVPEVADLGRWMGRDASVLRTGDGLAALADRLEHAALDASPRSAGATAPASLAEVEAANQLLSARALVAAALARTESRGCHRRGDHPSRDPRWLRHQSWQWTSESFVPVDQEPVPAQKVA